jgi:cytochrome c oxidase cbb3-type subunit 3
MFRQYLEQIAGVGIYPMFSLLVFFVFFVTLILYVTKADKKEMEIHSQLPLQSNEDSNA